MDFDAAGRAEAVHDFVRHGSPCRDFCWQLGLSTDLRVRGQRWWEERNPGRKVFEVRRRSGAGLAGWPNHHGVQTAVKTFELVLHLLSALALSACGRAAFRAPDTSGSVGAR